MEENMIDKHLGMVVEEDKQVLIAFKTETIDFIADTLKISDGDVVEILSEDDEIVIKKLK
jgi:hypothetical protein